ncbi:hypothetical protein WJX73_005762 [Symbiochloris irregularis]|uniref:Protein kinase domain-containing protein n=1 Tax=Symbiochloris irregularis TaxID=706552 RepID=A0AAW1NWS8_9CHLO
MGLQQRLQSGSLRSRQLLQSSSAPSIATSVILSISISSQDHFSQIYTTLRNLTTGQNSLLQDLQDTKEFTGISSVYLQSANPVVVHSTPSGVGSSNNSSSNSPANPAGKAASSTSSSAGAIAGGVVGGVVGTAVLALSICLFARRRRSKLRAADQSKRQDQTGFLQAGERDRRASNSFLGSHSSNLPLTAQLLHSNTSRSLHTDFSSSSSGSPFPDSLSSLDRSGNQWYIDPQTLTVCRHPDGTPVKLGSGGYGSVYKALHNGVRHVAVKLSNSGEEHAGHIQAFWREIELIASCRDANILQFYGACTSGAEVMLVTEFCDRGDLYHAIQDEAEEEHCDGQFCWYQRGRGIALDVARGLFSLHSRRIVHLDVKSPNVLLTRDYLAKIADVGLAHPLLSRTHLTPKNDVLGTWAWQAPETITGAAVTTAADIWSFGVIMWELMTGERPQRGRYRTPRVPDEGPQNAVTLMQACMSEDPASRPTAGQIISILEASDEN